MTLPSYCRHSTLHIKVSGLNTENLGLHLCQSIAYSVLLIGHSTRLYPFDPPPFLCSSGCNKILQWDLSRSVPRKVNEISVFTGDIQGLTTGAGRLFSCGADGSIRSWIIEKKGGLTPSVMREKAHKERVSAVIYKSVRLLP